LTHVAQSTNVTHMPRWFNIAGPCYAEDHYMVPPERRAVEAVELIEQGRWFSLVSGRQTGKTTVAQHIAKSLGSRGDRLVLWVDLETARGVDDPAASFAIILAAFERTLERDAPLLARPSHDDMQRWLTVPQETIVRYLSAVCAASERPVVLLLDEADVLTGAAMVSFLTQLRAAYLSRKSAPAPWSVVLIGVRAVRDYVVGDDPQRTVPWLGSASPFNITVENVTLTAFTEEEVVELTAQHTSETGQRFDDGANARIWQLSQGHPWLVNALADQATRRDVKDRTVAITAEHIERAKETMILERRTHIDSLLARLREDQVRRVLDPMIAGTSTDHDVLDDDFSYVAGLGLIRKVEGAWRIANPIYREVVPRALSAVRQYQIDQKTAWYVRPDGGVDVPKLMWAWQTFWRKDGHLAAEGFSYRESGPHLMLMAFLQRVVNGGGRIDREYALGKGALDLLITWNTQRIAIEVKLRRDTETEAEALEQVAGYLDALALDEGWLVMFDLRATTDWATRLYQRTEHVGAKTVHIIGS
jgi:type II secretory pathway predicted ATPase ExeA